ncbi:MAG: hypothetical protein Q9187_003546 [Circinaria calcarea]
MPNLTPLIRRLPAEVAAQIKSSTLIPSLSNAVLGLLDNALDSGARNIDIAVDFRRGVCTVEDDGLGIHAVEFGEAGGLGVPYHTSRFDSKFRFHGRNGTFLSSLAALSILTITSHHHELSSHSTLILHHSRPAARLIPSPSHHHVKCRDHGTRVTVQDLFGNMPVRVKHRALQQEALTTLEKDWEALCKDITGTLLAWDIPISLRMRGLNRDQKLVIRASEPVNGKVTLKVNSVSPRSFDINLLQSILAQGIKVNPTSWDTWIKASAQTLLITIRAIISLQPAPSKHTQFISLGIQHLHHDTGFSVLYDEVNRTFASSSYGAQEELDVADDSEVDKRAKDRRFKHDGFTKKQLKGGGKGIDRWPMFYIRIDLLDSTTSLDSLPNNGLAEKGSTLTSIIDVLRSMVVSFLAEHHLRPRARRSKKRIVPHEQATPTKPSNASPKNISSRDLRQPSEKKGSIGSHPATPNIASATARHELQPSVRPVPSVHDFGKAVRLPKFPRGDISRSQDDFSEWSRIKSGTRSAARAISHELPISSQKPAVDTRPPTNSLAGELPGIRSHSEVIDEYLSGDGQFTESPKVSDEPPSHSGQIHNELGIDSDASRTSLAPDDGLQSNYDEKISWTNPVTKATHLLNARTGLLIAPPRVSTSSSSGSIETLGIRSQRPLSSLSSLSMRSKLSRSATDGFSTPKSGSWCEDLLKGWENPVFCQTEENIPQVSMDGPALEKECTTCFRPQRGFDANMEMPFTETSSPFSAKFSAKLSRAGLENATILTQVDKKFILVTMTTAPEDDDSQVLVIIDQHAADERIRIESLLADICAKPSSQISSIRSALGHKSAVETTRLAKPVKLQIKPQEHRLFQKYADVFARWGILFDLDLPQLGPSLVESQEGFQVVVRTLPPGIAERCRIDPKQLYELMRGEIWKREEDGTSRAIPPEAERPSNPEFGHLSDSASQPETEPVWIHRIRDCPQGILDMLNSRSCRSAIMFNDELTVAECETLVRRLAACRFPFQCAHGRPSMVPLVAIGSLSQSVPGMGFASGPRKLGGDGREQRGFGDAWKRWTMRDG